MAWELYLDEAFGPGSGGRDVIVGGWVDPTAASSGWLRKQICAILPDVGWPLHATEFSGWGVWVCAALSQSVRRSSAPGVVEAAERASDEAQAWYAGLGGRDRVNPDSVWRDRASFNDWIHGVPRRRPLSQSLRERLGALRAAVELALVDMCRGGLEVEGMCPPQAVFAHLPAAARPDLRGAPRLAATIAVAVERALLWASVARPGEVAELRLHPAMSGGLTDAMLDAALAGVVVADGAPAWCRAPLVKYDAEVHAGLVLADWVLHRVTSAHTPVLWMDEVSLNGVHSRVWRGTGLQPGTRPRSLAAAGGEPRQRVLSALGATPDEGEPASPYRWHDDQAVAWIGELR